MERMFPTGSTRGLLSATLSASLLIAGGGNFVRADAQSPNPDAAATTLLNNARAARNEKNYAAAADQLRNFIKNHPTRAEIPAARYDLALALLETPERDYEGAVEALLPLVPAAGFPQHARVFYYLGFSYRGLGNHALEQISANPGEAQPLRAAAAEKFEKAATQFSAAAAAFAATVKAPPPTAVATPAQAEWAARARCDQAEMLIRLNKFKEAAAAAEQTLKDPLLAKSRYHRLAAYYHGYASFAQKDYLTAGRSLSVLAPFDDRVVGIHARYLLARIHHLSDERIEAATHYEAVVNGYASARKAAEDALKQSDAFKDDPDERARLESITREAADYVPRAGFYWGVVLQEQARYPDAVARFSAFTQQYSRSPLVPEARLRQGTCQLELKQYLEAMHTLSSLQNHAQFADQAMWLFGRAQVSSAEPTNPRSFVAAIDTFTKAADRAKAAAAVDPDAKVRRGKILMDLADAQQSAKLAKEAVATYQAVLKEGYADHAEAALQRLAIAFNQAGQFKESDEACQRFLTSYPHSILVPAILSRAADNAFLAGTAQTNREESKRLYTQAIQRYQALIDKYPEFQSINLARQGIANAHYLLGQFGAAATALDGIPDGERTGELASVSYLQADCLIRTLPADSGDALSTNRMIEQIERARKLLEGFLSGNDNTPQAPDAYIKLGYCHQRLGSVLADPNEKRNALRAALDAYRRLYQRFPGHPLFATAVLENARVRAELGDIAAAANQLSRFETDPLRKFPVAPQALIQLSEYLRIQKKPADAVELLNRVSKQYEADLAKDPARADLIPTLHYNQGLALKDSGKFAEALAIFETLRRQFPARPEALDALRQIGQSRRDEAIAQIAPARKALEAATVDSPEAKAAQATIDKGVKNLRTAADYLQTQAAAIAQKNSEPRLKMLFDAAVCYRALGEIEATSALRKVQQDRLKQMQDRLAKDLPAGQTPPLLRLPEIRPTAVPLQPSEQRAREQYKSLIEDAGDSPIATDARQDLAELHAQREEYGPAITLLNEAMDSNPSADTTENIHLRLGTWLVSKNEAKAAKPHFDAVIQNQRSPLAALARVGLGECLILQKDWPQAIERLRAFRDRQDLKDLPGITDRGLIRLGQAYARAGQWEPSRQIFERILAKFPNSPWANEARYGAALAMQNLKQHDAAVTGYTELTKRSGAEVAAKAQFQIGLCRMEQKRYADAADAFLAVVYTYGYPEISASALCEAAKAMVELDKKPDATRLLQRVIKDNPTGQWADLARKLLSEIK